MVAAKIANLAPGRPAETAAIDAVSQTAAAEMLNVSRESVQRAAVVVEHGMPELAEAVEAGEVSVSAAAGRPARPLAPGPATGTRTARSPPTGHRWRGGNAVLNTELRTHLASETPGPGLATSTVGARESRH
jgi:hypothetical protein